MVLERNAIKPLENCTLASVGLSIITREEFSERCKLLDAKTKLKCNDE